MLTQIADEPGEKEGHEKCETSVGKTIQKKYLLAREEYEITYEQSKKPNRKQHI